MIRVTAVLLHGMTLAPLAEEVADEIESARGAVSKQLGLRKDFPYPEGPGTVRGRNFQRSGGSMPLFTVTMKSNGSTSQKDLLSREHK